MYPVILMCIEI